MSTTYRVTFDRIGRNRNVSPITVEVDGVSHLADRIFTYARPHLRSSDVEVLINDDVSGGLIACGFQSGGRFTIAEQSEVGA